MAEITASMVKELRERTDAPMMDCKKALSEAEGDMTRAEEILRVRFGNRASKAAGRVAAEGMVGINVSADGKLGAMVEVNCETDFVANTKEFQEFAKDIAMQITASNPLYAKREDVPQDLVEKEKEIYKKQALESGKPEKIVDRIAEGKLGKFYQEICLVEQSYIKNPDITVKELMEELIVKMGEKLLINRFIRFQLGETIEE
jgi:elongation factor Ts